ncbi:hypothetical protein KIL84_017678 [Mauremys mutica]|uniref:Uncharacterized protein n=1 Tax=Mauremys mutica TaxID=74926 RepID=A0A9D3X4R8_9SAUR|nr:hypothetical protein KIL84_017678 [Mauremys mutica]
MQTTLYFQLGSHAAPVRPLLMDSAGTASQPPGTPARPRRHCTGPVGLCQELAFLCPSSARATGKGASRPRCCTTAAGGLLSATQAEPRGLAPVLPPGQEQVLSSPPCQQESSPGGC